MKKMIDFNGRLVYAELGKYSAYVDYKGESVQIFPAHQDYYDHIDGTCTSFHKPAEFISSDNCPIWLFELACHIEQAFYEGGIYHV